MPFSAEESKAIKTYKFSPWFYCILTIAYIFFSYTVISLLTERLADRQVQQQKEVIQHELALVRYSIEANIFRDTYLADSFASVVALDPQFATKNWDLVSAQFLSKSALVRNIGLAPDDVITHVYPLKGNEKAVGLDFRTVPNQYRTVRLARDTKQVFLAGPLQLVQGGTAIIARYPIFTDVPHNTEYWGGLSVVISYDKLIELSNLHNLQGAEVALAKNGNNNAERQLIEGNPSTLSDFDIQYPIHLPNGSWSLLAKYKNLNQTESINQFHRWLTALGAMTFFAGYLLIVFFINNYLRAHKHSLHDELTHLPNRRYLFNELNRMMSKSGAQLSFTVLNIDLNKFKTINDTFGHEAGDKVLKHTASLLKKSIRSADFIARMGGDEFVVILHRTSNQQDVEQIIHKMHLLLESSPLKWQDEKIWLSLSIGYYMFNGKADKSIINDVLSKADQSMYKNKTASRA